jgi:stage IV sporulation protein FB
VFEEGNGIRIFLQLISFLPMVFFALALGDAGVYRAIMAALIHEAGHVGCALALGVGIKNVVFGVGGITIRTESRVLSCLGEALLLVSGPAVNIGVWLVGYLINSESVGEFARANLILGIFNLMPIKGLDGGGVAALLGERIMAYEKAYYLQKYLSLFFVLVLWFSAITSMIFFQGNASLYCVFFALFMTFLRHFE